MDAEVKGLHWLANMWPMIEQPKDDADRMSNCIHLYCEAAANKIEQMSDSIDYSRQIQAENIRLKAELEAAVRDLRSVCEETGEGCAFCKKVPCSPENDHCTGWEWRGRMKRE